MGPAAELPLPVFGDQPYPEDTRLRYRFLDLRREKLHQNIMLRGQVIDSLAQADERAGVLRIPDADPHRLEPRKARATSSCPRASIPGKFYALPQAPQQYKQLLMMAGFDRYFQIAPCFRDEDPRADRLPGEFYQLDVEMSFVEQEDVFAAMEPVIRGVFEEFADGKPVTPSPGRGFPMPRRCANMAPTSRTCAIRSSCRTCPSISAARASRCSRACSRPTKNEVWAIPAPGGGQRTFADRMNSWAQSEGQPGLGYILFFDRAKDETTLAADPKATGVGARGPLANNIGPERAEAIRAALGLKAGDAAFFVAGDPDKFAKFAGLARTKIGQELKLVDENRFEFCWVVDFPMFEWNEEEKKIEFSHNPFSMPQGGLEALTSQDPLTIKAFQYDVACNGYELASGGIRNHRPEAMVKAFEIAGYGEETVIERFGGMYRAFHYGAPPHGGMAAGVDRIVMLLAGEQNLREVALFPMNQRAEDLLMGAPAPATPKQLRELSIRVVAPEK